MKKFHWNNQRSYSMRASTIRREVQIEEQVILKVHPWNYFCIFYLFEPLKLCKIVELCFPKNPMFFVFRFQRFLAGK